MQIQMQTQKLTDLPMVLPLRYILESMLLPLRYMLEYMLPPEG